MDLKKLSFFPLLRAKLRKKMLSHIRNEHGRIYDLVLELASLVKGDFGPFEALEKAAELRGTHTTHIHMESLYFYPMLDDVSVHEAEKIIERFKKRSFDGYPPRNE